MDNTTSSNTRMSFGRGRKLKKLRQESKKASERQKRSNTEMHRKNIDSVFSRQKNSSIKKLNIHKNNFFEVREDEEFKNQNFTKTANQDIPNFRHRENSNTAKMNCFQSKSSKNPKNENKNSNLDQELDSESSNISNILSSKNNSQDFIDLNKQSSKQESLLENQEDERSLTSKEILIEKSKKSPKSSKKDILHDAEDLNPENKTNHYIEDVKDRNSLKSKKIYENNNEEHDENFYEITRESYKRDPRRNTISKKKKAGKKFTKLQGAIKKALQNNSSEDENKSGIINELADKTDESREEEEDNKDNSKSPKSRSKGFENSENSSSNKLVYRSRKNGPFQNKDKSSKAKFKKLKIIYDQIHKNFENGFKQIKELERTSKMKVNMGDFKEDYKKMMESVKSIVKSGL